MIAEHTSYLTGYMVVVNNKRAGIPTDNTLFDIGLDAFKLLVRDYVTKLTTTNFVSIRRTTSSAPAIQPVYFLVMRGEKLGCSGFALFTTCAG
jgi:hypothetical protein